MVVKKHKPTGKKWHVFEFVVEIAVQAGPDVDEIEASEIAYSWLEGPLSMVAARIDNCLCSITRFYELPPASAIRAWLAGNHGNKSDKTTAPQFVTKYRRT